MKTFALVAVLLVVSVLSEANIVRYDGYQVYKVMAKDMRSVEALRTLQRNTLEFDFWTDPTPGKPTDIMTPPGKTGKLIHFLDEFQMSYEIKIADVQKLIDDNRYAPKISQRPRHSRSLARYAHNWTSYSRLQTIYDFVNELGRMYPDLVQVSTIGQTYEKRDILMTKVSTGSSTNKNAIFIDGGIHAREWISPAVVTWIMSELIENNAAHPEMTNNLDWYFVTNVNPDGYEYSHTTDRLWRKNRFPSGTCFGVDNNRNFGYHWSEGGTSNIPCSDIYHGASAFSELESQHLRDVILEANKNNKTKCYLTFHSYGQDMLTPWSYQNSPLPDNYQAMLDLGKRATDALTAVFGTKYGVGNSYELYGATAGSSDDWSKGGAGIPYAYTVELRDEGRYGFELPANQILDTAVETWELVRVVANQMMNES